MHDPHKPLTRRRFLQGAAAAAAPLLIPSAALGQERKTAPSERITVGFIGCGKMAFDYNLAYWHGRRLKWAPARWQFVDDAEANGWLDRERRDAWPLPHV